MAGTLHHLAAARELLRRAECTRLAPGPTLQAVAGAHGIRNDLAAEQVARQARRGGMLDKNRGETGLQQRITVGNQVDLLQLSAANRTNPEVITVGVDVKEEAPPNVNPPADVRLQTIISWGIGKGISTAVVDTRLGGQITVSASILNVAVLYPPPVFTMGGPSTVFLVSGIVGYGNRPGSANPALTFTDALIPLAQGSSTAPGRTIPKYAVSVAWTSDGSPVAATAPAAVLTFFGQNTGSASVVATAAPDPNVFIPIPNGSYFITIANVSPGGAAIQGFRLIYELVL